MPVECRWAAAPVVAALTGALVFAVPAVAAAFGDQGTAASTFTAAPDWVAPEAGTTVIAKTTGYLAGFIKQGGTYYVYANVTDSGNPPSGVATERADSTQLSAGASSTTLTAGTWSVGGITSNYRSGALGADAALAEGARTYALTSTDAAGNSRTQPGFTVTVDNTRPTATDIQAADHPGGTDGEAEPGETITFTFSEQIDPQSVVAGWTGAATSVSVRVIDGGCVLGLGLICHPDHVQIYDAANSAQLPLGDLELPNGGYNGVLLAVVFRPSTMVQSGNVITVTLGPLTSGDAKTGGSGQTTWTPSTTPYDAAGNLALGNAANESGGGDREF
ncbi:MAG: hypothetical protein ACRDZ3_09025 [Acidimicrobiia bacterium]